MMKKSWIVLSLMLMFININAFAKELKAGSWKFFLRTNHAEIPFIIEFKYNKKKELTGKLRNGLETISLKGIKQSGKDVVIPISAYELTLELSQQESNTLSGFLIRHNKNPVMKSAVIGIHGITERFKFNKEKAYLDLNGKWSFVMEDENGQKTPGIGIFKQKGNFFTGSILTPTGDFRYLEGVVVKHKFEAASFDGVYNYAFSGTIIDGKMQAMILSNFKTKVSGHLDPKAELPDAYKQTELKELKFIFPNVKGENVSLNHPKFKNKPVIVQIYGSWCPNCMDEMKFLIPWYKQNSKRGVEVVALAFERSLGPDDARKQLRKVQDKYKVPYPILQVGSTAEDKPADKLPGLKNFISFPTTVFLNKKHEVVKVHAGFSGPSTGEFFETWKKEFNQTVNGLLK